MQAGQLEIEILANVARLQSDMEKIKRSVGDMQGDVARKSKAANDNLNGFAGGVATAGNNSRLASHHVQNLSFQLQDMFIGLSSGQKPLTVFLQQGSQIGGIMQQAGVGVGALTREVAVMAARFAPAAAVIGGTAFVLKQYLDVVNEGANTDAFVRSLGLTKEEMKELGDTTVTAGDLMLGTWDVVAGGLWDVIGPAVTDSKKSFMDWFWESDKAGRESVNNLIGAFVGGFNAIKAVWGQLPAALGDLFVQAVNAGIAAINSLIRGSVQGINDFITQANTVLGKVGVALPKLGTPEISAVVNANAGAAAKVGEVWKSEMDKAKKDYVGTFGRAIGDAGGDRPHRRLREQADESSGGRQGRTGTLGRNSREDALAKEVAATEEMIKSLYRLADAYGVSEAAALKEQIVSKATAEALSKGADVASYVDRQLRLAIAQKTADAAKDVAAMRAQTDAQAKLNQRMIESGMAYDDAAQLMKDEAQLRPLLTALAIAEGDAKAKLADIIATLRNEQKRANDEAALTKALQDAQDYERNVIAPLEREAQVLGLVGWQRERALLLMEREAELNPLLAKQADALAKGNYALAEAIGKQIELRIKGFNLQVQMGDREDADRKAREELELYNDGLRQTISLLERLGGFGSVLGGILGLISGNAGAIGGPIGDLLNIQTGLVQDPSDPNRQVAKTLADELREIFKLDGQFGKTMTSLLQGAGTGMTAAAAFGMTGKGNQIGSAIGGALGKVAGEALGKVVGGTLGKALGPLGSILGGVAGGLIGGLLSKKPSASANLSGGDSVSITGNNKSGARDVATGLGAEVQKQLKAIADAFGGAVGAFAVSIGVSGDSYHVDPTGKGRLKKSQGGKDFDQDAQAAIAYAIADAIRDGAIVGIRESTKRLIQGGSDISAQLQKALDFEGVFKDLKQRLDPLGYALEEIGREAERLRKIFAEASATTEEYAQLEQLLQLKREDALEQARKDAIDKIGERRELEIRILELLGREQDAIAASRELELAGLKASLRPLQSMIYQLEDARIIMERFGPLAADLRALKQEIVGGETSNSFKVLTARFRDIAALAKNGDADALGKFRNSATEYLDAAKENARSALDYRRAVGEVLAATDAGIFAADTQVEYAQMQIDAIAAQSDILTSIKDQLETSQAAIAANTAKTAILLQRFEGDGLTVKTDSDTPLFIKTGDGSYLQVEVVTP